MDSSLEGAVSAGFVAREMAITEKLPMGTVAILLHGLRKLSLDVSIYTRTPLVNSVVNPFNGMYMHIGLEE